MARKIKDGQYTQWYRHNIDRWQGSAEIAALSLEGYKAFHNLLMYQFQRPDGLLPDDGRLLRVQSRLQTQEQWECCRAEVLALFEPMGDGKIANKVMYSEWKRAREFQNERVKAGRRGGQKKQANRLAKASPATSELEHSYDPELAKHGTERYVTEQDGTEEDISDSAYAESSPRAVRSGKPTPYEGIYQAYPRHVGKKAAIDAIKSAVQRVQSRTKAKGGTKLDAQRWLYARTQAFARSAAGNRGSLTPHPATWFNQGRYDDNPTEWEQVSDGANHQRSGFNRTKSERNLDALREAIGLAPAMDLRSTDAGGECAPGDHIGSGSAPVLDGITGLRQGGHCGRGSGAMQVQTQ
jgi:hypothetical protein